MLRSVSAKDLTTRRPATAFPMNLQWVTVGALLSKLLIPPPLSAELPINVQWVTVASPLTSYIQPPPSPA